MGRSPALDCGFGRPWVVLPPRRQRWHRFARRIPQPHRYQRVAHLTVPPAFLDVRVENEEQRCRTLAVGQRRADQRAVRTQVVSKPLHEGPQPNRPATVMSLHIGAAAGHLPLAGAAAITLHAGTGRCKPLGTRLPAGSSIAANSSPAPSSAPCTRSETRISPPAASPHSRADSLVTLPIAP